MFKLLTLKRKIENIIILPFIAAGFLYSRLHPLQKKYRVFFFFPFYHTGGAEKVHAQITKAAGGNDCIVFFTKKSVNKSFLDDFKKSGCDMRDISHYTDNKWLYFLNIIYRGIITGYINNQKGKTVIFNGQCNFGYKISPWVSKNVTQIELIHSFNSFSYIRIPFIPFIDQTVMISKKRIDDHLSFYQKKGIPETYANRIIYIPNASKLPVIVPPKANNELIVLYVGRGGKEKRVHLVAAIAEGLLQINQNIKFQILGDVSNIMRSVDYPYIHFYGNIHEEPAIADIYAKAHILILTSDTEGFPMVIIEGMAYGCAVIATPVGDIPYHIKNNETGFLFSSTENEDVIVKEGVEIIRSLNKDRNKLNLISETNIQYAIHNFGIDSFNNSYNSIIKANEH